jgi:hypothetical protein
MLTEQAGVEGAGRRQAFEAQPRVGRQGAGIPRRVFLAQ